VRRSRLRRGARRDYFLARLFAGLQAGSDLPFQNLSNFHGIQSKDR